jgi:hypothetical protein
MCSSLNVSEQVISGIDRYFSFLILHTAGNTPWTVDQPVAGPLPARRRTQTHNKRTQASMPQVGFETSIPVFGRAKTVRALDGAPTVIGKYLNLQSIKHFT